jgi:hypothetical protein
MVTKQILPKSKYEARRDKMSTEWRKLHKEELHTFLSSPRIVTYSMEQSPSCEANSHTASQVIPYLLLNPRVHYRIQKSPPISSPCLTFRNKLGFYGEELLAPRPTPSWRTTLCRQSATTYAIHSHLSSVSSIPALGHTQTPTNGYRGLFPRG